MSVTMSWETRITRRRLLTDTTLLPAVPQPAICPPATHRLTVSLYPAHLPSLGLFHPPRSMMAGYTEELDEQLVEQMMEVKL